MAWKYFSELCVCFIFEQGPLKKFGSYPEATVENGGLFIIFFLNYVSTVSMVGNSPTTQKWWVSYLPYGGQGHKNGDRKLGTFQAKKSATLTVRFIYFQFTELKVFERVNTYTKSATLTGTWS